MRFERVFFSAAMRAAIGCVALLYALPASAQLRIASYNTATAQNPGTQTARPGHSTILEAIGAELVGGVAKPIDVLLLQEQFTMQLTTQSFVDALNSIYGAGAYARSTLNGQTSDPLARAGRPGLVYNTQTVQLIGETLFGDVGTGNGVETVPAQQPRSTLRYQLRPVGYDSSADFYAYSSHWVSDTGVRPNNRRLVQAESTRANADALGEGAHLIYAGDFNIQSSTGDAYQHMLSAGNGQAVDPINMPGSWNGNSSFKAIHTQSPVSDAGEFFGGQTGGGMDDRLDFQLVSGEMLDGEGMSYLTGSYHAFGNNGTHACCNSDINTGTGASPAVLLALMQSSDHLPVIADYQLPASMGVEVASAPMSVTLGESISLGVTVSNIADAVIASGVDELDYTLSVSGDLSGGAGGIDFALGGGNLHQVTLNTATLGAKSGVITVTSSSQGAANALFTMPISFEVVSPFLAADFDEDGSVDGDDLAAWSSNFGLAGVAEKDDGDADSDGDVDGADFLVWQQQLGTTPLVAAAASVPEPAAVWLALCAGVAALRRSRSVNPRSVKLMQLHSGPTGRRLIARGESPWFQAKSGSEPQRGDGVTANVPSPRWGFTVLIVGYPGACAPGY